MRIAPVMIVAPSMSASAAPVVPLDDGRPPRPAPPLTDAKRMSRTVAFTKLIADELDMFAERVAADQRDSAATWADAAEQNFETIYRFALDTPAMSARDVQSLALAGGGAAWELARDTRAGAPAAELLLRARVLATHARDLGLVVQSIIDAG